MLIRHVQRDEDLLHGGRRQGHQRLSPQVCCSGENWKKYIASTISNVPTLKADEIDGSLTPSRGKASATPLYPEVDQNTPFAPYMV